MKKRYKISFVAKMLGISPSALRFYENKGFVAPSRDNETGYRYFDRGNLVQIIRAKFMQSLGFTLGEATDTLMKGWTVQQWQEEIELQRVEIQRQLKKFEFSDNYLREQQVFLENISSLFGTYQIKTCPEILWFQHSDEGEHIAQEQRNIKQAVEWIDRFPIVNYMFFTKKEYLYCVETSPQKLEWGFGVKKENLGICRFEPDDRYLELPSHLCVYTIARFPTSSNNTSSDTRLFQDAMKYINQKGYSVAGNAWGRYICTIRENGIPQKYYEVYIPINK